MEEFKAITIALLCVLAIITTLINMVCICIIIKSKVLLKRPSTYFILNLLTVHLIQGLIVFPFYAAKKAEVISLEWGQIVCDGFRFTYMVTFYSAIFGVLLIGFDRVLATCWVWRYKEMVTKKRVVAVILVVWLYIIGACLIPFGDHDTKNTSKYERDVRNETNQIILPHMYNLTKEPNVTNAIIQKVTCTYQQSRLWTILMLVLNCMVPYLVIVCCYQVIIYKINKMEKRTRSMTTYSIPSNQNSDNQKKSKKHSNALLNNGIVVMNAEDIRKHKHVTHLAMILSVAYFFFWSPSVIYFVLWSVCPSSCFTTGYKDSEAEPYIGFITKYLAFLDALAAPLIYCFYHEQFRNFIPCKKLKNPESSKFIDNQHKTYVGQNNTILESLQDAS